MICNYFNIECRAMKNAVCDLEKKVDHLKTDLDKAKITELENIREHEKKDLSVKTLQSRLANTNSVSYNTFFMISSEYSSYQLCQY